jgi:hypothetical protein
MIRITSLVILFFFALHGFGQDMPVIVSDTDTVSKAVSISESESDSISESASDSVSKAVSISESASDSVSKAVSISESESESESVSISESASDSVSKAVSISESNNLIKGSLEGTKFANMFHASVNAKKPWLDYVSIDGRYGIHYLHGDISETKSIPKFNSDFRDVTGRSSGISVNRANIYSGIGASLHYNQGEIRGVKYVRHNNNYYTSSMNYFNVMLDAFYPIKFIHSEFKGPHSRYELHPHVGVGLAFYRSKSIYTHEVQGGKTFQYYGYLAPTDALSSLSGALEKTQRELAFVVPLGIKLKVYLNSRFDLNIDYTYVKSFTDKLDGWEKEGTANDSYSGLTCGISYNFNRLSEDVDFSSLDFTHGSSGKTAGNEDGGNSGDSSYNEDGEIDPSSLSSKDRMMDLLLKLYKTQLRIIQYQHLDE